MHTWPLDRLTPHPRQAALFGEPTEEEIRALAEDLRQHDLQHPVEILPDGTILCGHRRVAAARLLGWVEIRVRVRADLAGEPAAAEARLIRDNLVRRQLGPLAVARCYLHLRQLGDRRASGPIRGLARGDLRDQIGRQLGLSGRHLDRLLAIAERCPVEVQIAVERGHLPIATASRVAGLRPEQRDTVAAAIRSGGDPRTAVEQAVGKRATRSAAVGQVVYRLVAQLRRAIDEIGSRTREIRGVSPDAVRVLRRAEEWIRALIRQSDANGAPGDPRARTRGPGSAATRARVSKYSDQGVRTNSAPKRGTP